MNKIAYFLFCLVILILTSCVETVEINLPNPAPKITVISLFSNVSYWKVQLISNASLEKTSNFSTSYEPNMEIFNFIENAKVELYENGNLISNLHYQDNGIYIDSLLYPVPGNLYTIKISAPGFPDVEASDSIPQDLIYISKSINATNDSVLPYIYEFAIKRPSEKSYYISKKYSHEESLSEDSSHIVNNDFYSYVEFPKYANDYLTVGRGDFALFTDENFPSDEILKFEYLFGIEYSLTSYSIKLIQTISFGRCSEAFYKYINDLRKLSDESYIFSEYSDMYSNIKQGYGIFAGVNITTDTLVLYEKNK